MLSVEEALARVTSAFRPLASEPAGLAEALGRVLAEDVAARVSQPPADVSAMDGYAVHSEDVAEVPARLRRVGESPAGGAFSGRLGPGEAVRIFTGGPVPAGADAIVIQENTETDGDTVVVREGAPAGRFIRRAGLDFKEGEVGLRAGRRLTPRDIGLAAAMNVATVAVRQRPRVAVLATGDELAPAGEAAGPNRLPSSNGPGLCAFVAAHGGEPVDLGIAGDSTAALKAAAEGARRADLLVTTGGISVGERDLVQSALKEMGLEVDFWKVAMRPGKPLMFGRMKGLPVLAFPGNPVSALVCAVIYLRPALAVMLGLPVPAEPSATAVLGGELPPNDERQDYLRARLETGEDGAPVVTPFARQDSAMLSRLAHADCLVVRAPFAPRAAAGERVPFIPLTGGPWPV